MATITIHGNLAADPELRYTQGGKAVANLRVLENTRSKRQGEWTTDPDPTAHNVTAWGALAENIVESLHKGDNVLVIGTTRTESYTVGERAEAATRTKGVVTATAVGASLQHSTVSIASGKRTTEETQDQ